MQAVLMTGLEALREGADDWVAPAGGQDGHVEHLAPTTRDVVELSRQIREYVYDEPRLRRGICSDYDAFIVRLGGPVTIRCVGDAVERIRWEGEFLVVGNVLGYRIHDAAGELICVDASPKGLSATCFVPVPPRGVRHCIRRSVLESRDSFGASKSTYGHRPLAPPHASPRSPSPRPRG